MTDHASVPGVWRTYRPETDFAPLVVDSPHSGRIYPDDFDHAVALSALRSAEDAYVDQLCAGVTAGGGALLVADFPRSYVDVNRDFDDLDPAILSDKWPGNLKPGTKSKLGIGLIRARLANGEAIYNRRLAAAEVARRIDEYYHPYHERLTGLLNHTHAHHGAVWHIDMHSMASSTNAVTPESRNAPRPFDFVLGDLNGQSCEQGFTRFVYDYFDHAGYRVQVNVPYKGAAITRNYGKPHLNRHTLQIEINRALYLDERGVNKTTGFQALKQFLDCFFQAAGQYTLNCLGEH